MGLDMYLYAERYVSAYAFDKDEDKAKVQAVLDAVGVCRIAEQSPHIQVKVKVCVAYWRKVNAVHGWFVRNCANDVDDCEAVHVGRTKLLELVELCKSVLESRDAGGGLEPIFGPTDPKDGWYWTGLEQTIAQVTAALEAFPADGLTTFEYRASW